MHQIYIISDGTGKTAEQALKAALTQFVETEVQLNIRSHVCKEEQVLKVINEASATKGFIVHTVVSRKLREKILNLGRLHDVETVDIMGPLLAQLTHQFAHSPLEKPGLFRELNKAYFQRIEALEFAFRHDDGQRVEELEKSEIVLLGVSRTFKTPLSVYLSFKNWLVANIPVVLNIPLPEIVYDIPPERIFCLVTNARRLALLRSVRARHFGGATGYYSDLEHVRQEIAYSWELFNKHPGWSKIDVTNKPIEEIAFEIVNIIRK